jgi:hypothetical protein
MGWESHVSLVPVLGVGGALDDSSVQFLALYAQAHADIPLFILPLVTLFSFGLLASSTGLLVDSMEQCSTIHVILWSRLLHVPIRKCKTTYFITRFLMRSIDKYSLTLSHPRHTTRSSNQMSINFPFLIMSTHSLHLS